MHNISSGLRCLSGGLRWVYIGLRCLSEKNEKLAGRQAGRQAGKQSSKQASKQAGRCLSEKNEVLMNNLIKVGLLGGQFGPEMA